jgi:hypothetical protein
VCGDDDLRLLHRLRQSGLVPPQRLETIATAVDEKEQVAVERTGLKHLTHQAAETVETLRVKTTHIRHYMAITTRTIIENLTCVGATRMIRLRTAKSESRCFCMAIRS